MQCVLYYLFFRFISKNQSYSRIEKIRTVPQMILIVYFQKESHSLKKNQSINFYFSFFMLKYDKININISIKL